MRGGGELRFVRADGGGFVTRMDKLVGATECSNELLRGMYGYNQFGSAIVGGAIGAAGTIEFDGNGAIVGDETLNADGSISSQHFTGIYIVRSDCAMTATLYYDSRPPRHLAGAVANAGSDLFFIDSDNMVVQSGTAVRQAQERDDPPRGERPCVDRVP